MRPGRGRAAREAALSQTVMSRSMEGQARPEMALERRRSRKEDRLPGYMIWGPPFLWLVLVAMLAVMAVELIWPETIWSSTGKPPAWLILAIQFPCVAMLGWVIRLAYRDAHLQRRGERRTGTITGYRSYRIRGRLHQFPLIRIEGSPFGGEVFKSGTSMSPELDPIGSQLPILVDPDNAKLATVDDPRMALTRIVLGVPFLAFIFLIIDLSTLPPEEATGLASEAGEQDRPHLGGQLEQLPEAFNATAQQLGFEIRLTHMACEDNERDRWCPFETTGPVHGYAFGVSSDREMVRSVSLEVDLDGEGNAQAYLQAVETTMEMYAPAADEQERNAALSSLTYNVLFRPKNTSFRLGDIRWIQMVLPPADASISVRRAE